MPYRGEMLFHAFVGSRAHGWSEQHYILGVSDLPAALTQLEQLANTRVPLLGANCVLNGLRVSDVDVVRDSQVDAGPDPAFVIMKEAQPGGGFAVTLQPRSTSEAPRGALLHSDHVFNACSNDAERADMFCDFPWAGYLLRLEGGTPYTQRRSLILRGNPDLVQSTAINRITAFGGALGPFAKWEYEFDAYVTELTSGKYGMRALPPAPAISSTTLNRTITNIVIENDGTATLTLGGTTPAVAPGDVIYIRRTKLLDADGDPVRTLNRKWVVATYSAPTMTLVGGVLDPTFGPYTFKAGGSFYKQGDYQYVPYTAVVERRWARRNTGLPFDRPRGRRRAGSGRFDYVVA